MTNAQDPQDNSDKNAAEALNSLITRITSGAVDLAPLIETQRKNTEALMEANRELLDGYRDLLRRQSEMVQDGLEDLRTAIDDVRATDGLSGMQDVGTDRARETLDKSVDNLRELGERALTANRRALEKLTNRLSASIDELRGIQPDSQQDESTVVDAEKAKDA